MKDDSYNSETESLDENKDAKRKKKSFILLNLPSLIIVFSFVLIITALAVMLYFPKETLDDQLKISVHIEPSLNYDSVGGFSDGMAMVGMYGKFSKYSWVYSWKYGFIDTNGKLVVPCEYDYAVDFNEGFATVAKNGKYGFADKTGKEVIPLEYDYAFCFSNGLAAVKKDDKYGFINSSGETMIPFEYDHAANFFYELTVVKKDWEYGIIDMNRNIIEPVEYDYIYIDYENGLFSMQKEDKRGLMDMEGNWILPCIYEAIRFNSDFDGLITVKQNGKWGVLKIENYTPMPKAIQIGHAMSDY